MGIDMRNLPAWPGRGAPARRAGGGWRSAIQDGIELILIVWSLPLVILALVLPLAAIYALIDAILHLR